MNINLNILTKWFNSRGIVKKGLAVLLLLMTLISCSANTSNTAPASPQVSASPAASAKPGTTAAPVVLNKDVFDTKKFEGQLRVYFFDFNEPNATVKAGDASEDCILIITPDNKTMLIDAARDTMGNKVVGYLDKLGVNKIDIAVASHRHGDHVGGYPQVISKKPIDKFIMAKYSPPSNVLSALSAKGIKAEYPEDGDKFKLGNEVEFEVFADNEGFEKGIGLKDSESTAFVNNKSMVLKMTYKNNSFLFPGDVHKEREMELALNVQRSIDVDVIKVPHHGYDTSSSSMFIRAVSPKFAVIEAYAITRPQVIMRYELEHAKVYTTADNGNVLITSDGDNLTVTEEKKVEKRKLY